MVVTEVGRAIEALFDGDAIAGLNIARVGGQDLGLTTLVLEGEVVGYHAGLELGEEGQQIGVGWQRAMGVMGRAGRDGEGSVPGGEKDGLEEAVGVTRLSMRAMRSSLTRRS
jgi:hypothetical protein